MNADFEVDLKKLFFDVLRHWRGLVIFLLIGAMLGSGISFANMRPATMADVDMENVDAQVIDSYKSYNDLLQQQLAYEEISPRLQLDSSNASYVQVAYHIDSTVTDVEQIAMLYRTLIGKSEVKSGIYQAAGFTFDPEYIGEMVSASYSLGTALSVQLESVSDLLTVPRTATIYYQLWANNEDECRAMLDVLKQHIAALDASCKTGYSNYTLSQLSEQYYTGRSSELVEAHREATTDKQTYSDQLKKLENTMTDDEATYYSILYPEDAEPKRFSKIWPVLMGVLMAAVYAVVIIVRSMLDVRIHRMEEIRDLFGLYVVANLNESQTKYKGLDALIHTVEHKHDIPFSSREYLLQSLAATGKESILVCGNRTDALIEDVGSWLDKQSEKITFTGSLYFDEAAQGQAKQADGVLLLIKLGKTSRASVIRSMEICKEMGFPLLGAVTLN